MSEQEKQEVIETEAVETEVQDSPEQASDAFNAIRGGAPSVDKKDAKETGEALEEAVVEHVADEVGEGKAEEVKEELRIAGYTEEQIKSLLDKAAQYDQLAQDFGQFRDRTYGVLGNLKQQIEQRGSVKLTGSHLKRFAQEYGEDVAQMLADDLADFITQGGAQTPSISQEQINDILNERLTQTVASVGGLVEERLLTSLHPDWKQVRAMPEFRTWLATQPAEYQKTANETEDAFELGKVFTGYKTWKKDAEDAAKRRQQRLEASVETESISSRPQRKQATAADGWAAIRGGR